MRILNYHHLYYFQVIANEGSIAKASKSLRLGQPTLSAQLKSLEEFLETQLFERRNKKLFITEAGQVVLDDANEIFSLGDELLEVIESKTYAKHSHVRIGAMESLPKRLIQLLVFFAQSDGNAKITVLEGAADYLLRELAAHRLDLVLSNFPPNIGDEGNFNSRLLASTPISIFGTKRFRHLQMNFPDSLQSQPFILPTLHSKLRHDLDHYFRLHNITINQVVETQDTSVQKVLGIEGLGLVPLPDFAGLELVKEKKLVNLGRLPDISEDFWIISGKRKITNPQAQWVMDNFELKI